MIDYVNLKNFRDLPDICLIYPRCRHQDDYNWIMNTLDRLRTAEQRKEVSHRYDQIWHSHGRERANGYLKQYVEKHGKPEPVVAGGFVGQYRNPFQDRVDALKKKGRAGRKTIEQLSMERRNATNK